jgi:hypothetical protein
LGTKEANTLWLATYFIGYIFGRWPGVIKVCAIGSAILLLFAVLTSNNITSDFKDRFILGRALHILFAVLIFSALLYACKGISIGNSLKISLLPPPHCQKTRFTGREYEIYLVHQTYILGPLSVIGYFNTLIDILISISLIIITVFLLIVTNDFVDSQLDKWIARIKLSIKRFGELN